MVERFSRWITSVMKGAARPRGTAAALVIAAGLGSMGCGTYEPEPEYPQQYSYVAPVPPTAEELAAQQRAREQAAAESREILVGADADEYSDTDPSALTEFKPALDGHGAWVEDASYGTVWVPSREEVGADFQPYVTAGHWTYSEATDYVWVSDYSWGWAPFHYGRWVYLPDHGWAWIPGRRYAGAWVTWRVGPAGYGYVGWAPAPPSWYWHHGVAYGWSFGWYHHHHHYVYCPREYVYHSTLPTHVVRGPAAREHDGRTQDYVAARPGVGGGDRVVANPSVNGGGGRVVATPAVGGSNRIPASPGVGNKGPRPDELGLKNEAVVAPPSSNQGLARAQALALPSTAVAAGAAPPAHARSSAAFAEPPSGSSRAPASAAFVPNGSRGIAAATPPPNVGGPSAAPPSTYHSAPNSVAPPPSAYRTTPSYASPPAPQYRPPPSAYRTPPSYSSSPSFRSSPPAVRSTPSFGSSSPSFRSSPPAVRSTPSFGSSSPSFRSSAPAVRSSPSFRSPSPSFRSSAPAVRSAPSIRATPSAPSRSAAPAVRGGGGVRRR